MQPPQPRIHADAVCHYGCRNFRGDVRDRRLGSKRLHLSAHRYRFDDWYAVCDQNDLEEKSINKNKSIIMIKKYIDKGHD